MSSDDAAAARCRYESPEMTPGRVAVPTAWALVTACALLVLAVPVWRFATEGSGEETRLAGEVRRLGGALLEREQGASPAGWNRRVLAALDGFETRLDEGSPVLLATRAWLQWLTLGIGGVGNETVYAGAEGWLLLRRGYDHLVGRPFLDPARLRERRLTHDAWRPAIEPDPRPALLDFRRQLAERGIDLLLVPVPTKPAIEASSLAPRASRPLANPSAAPFADAMAAAGIQVFDAAAVLDRVTRSGTAAYLRTDSHWSPAGVGRVAEELALWLESAYGPELGAADADWQATPIRRSGHGDLWHQLGLPGERPLLPQETVEADEITSWDGTLWRPSHSAAVLVLGDSFVNIYSDESLHWGRGAGFAEQLSRHLARPVDRIARNDGASDQVRRDLARSPRRLAGKRVVVYVFAARELSSGDWPLVRLGDS